MGIGTRSFTFTLGSPFPLGVGQYFTLENGTIGKFTTGVLLFSRAATISREIKIMHMISWLATFSPEKAICINHPLLLRFQPEFL